MPTVKGKGGSTSHRYRPASEYDDAALAQKREYWRTKKREQRARLSERREKPQDSHREKLQHLNAPVQVKSILSGSFAAPTLQSNDELHKTVSDSPLSQSIAEDSSLEVVQSQKEKWLQTMKLNKVLPQLPATCSITARAASNIATVKCLTARGGVNRAVTSPTPSGTQLDTSSSVPPVRVTRFINGSSVKTTPQPRVSMQGLSSAKVQHKTQVALRIQPKLLPTNVTTGMILVSSSCGPVSIKPEGKTANTTPQSRIKSALVTTQRAKGNAQPSPESEEERAAKRREHWRIKKREQRAKLAARIAKARERTQCMEMAVQRQTAQKTELVCGTRLQHLSSEAVLQGEGRKQCPARVKALFTSVKRENNKLQSRAASLTAINLQANQIKVQKTLGNGTAETAITSNVTAVKKTGESQRKFSSHIHLSTVTRGITRCKTPRQRFIEAQKNLMSQRNIRCKSPLLASLFGSRNIPRLDPNDTPEQVIAKRREYWRIKKREQRAKLSMEVKARLKEKDSLMRRVKRYQKILEEMRKARALTQSAGNTLTHASETIGGFIKEDGTVTATISQGGIDHNTAAHKSKEENHIDSNNTLITTAPPQHQPNAEPLCSAQVKVSFPLAGQLENEPPRLISQHESTTVSNSHSLAIQTVGQLTLTHPQTSLNTLSGGCTIGSNLSGCVMKMAVSSTAPSLSVLSVDPGLTEEERMAKKREYWRIKKREQRAARATRLKQGVLHARANAALQRRKAQKQLALINVHLSRSLTSHTGKAKVLSKTSGPVRPHANEIQQESESVPAVDLDSQPEQAICPDIKPPTSPPPPTVPTPEYDTALSADSQATTLLAVASMKKLLEESLSTVTEQKSEQIDIKMETTEEASEQDVKPNLPDQFFEKDEVSPIAADLTLQIKSWQPDTDALVHTGSTGPHVKDLSHLNETAPPYNEVLNPTCEHSTQNTSNFMVNPSSEATNSPSSPRRTQRLRTKKVSHQNCCSPEPPKLHHLPMDQLHPQEQHCEQQCQAQEECQNSNLQPAQRYSRAVMEQSGLTNLQKKREYWKLMKRQQRARLKARQKEIQGECSHLSSNIQAPGLVIINSGKGINPPAKLTIQPRPSIATLTAMPSIPTVLVTSPTTCNDEQSSDTLQFTLPISRNEQNNINMGSSKIISSCLGGPGGQQQAVAGSQKWMSRSTDVDSSPSLPTLRPPDNPLSIINLQPIELPDQTPNSSLSSIKIPCAQHQSPTHMTQIPTKLVHISIMVPPKPIPGESEEDFLRRKREYWRIKKKEQRARKAIQDKGITPKRASNNWRPILPAQDLQTQDSGQWVNSTEDSDHLMSTSVDADPGLFPNYTAPVEDESEILFADYENNDGEEGPVSDAVWRNGYLMDYDPLNQLLVCMVCGDLQYSHSLEAVRAHIDEAHPDTLTLDPGEQQRILEAWDEQVSQRERFFTSQLQQHSRSLAEAHRN